MKRTTKIVSAIITLLMLTLTIQAQSVKPTAYYSDKDGDKQEESAIKDAQAPLSVRFQANPSAMGEWTPSYAWHFSHTKVENGAKTTREIFVRYEEDTEYTFMESGTYTVTLKTTLNKGTDSDNLPDASITIEIVESKLVFPNAFSPNGDGINDIYRADPDYKSIVSFKAIILNRWGQKLYEWNDPAGGWDGKYHGSDVADGVYYVLVDAMGADGKEYKIKKDVNLLRGYIKNSQNP
jgi:gliding motility-associated-like protein